MFKLEPELLGKFPFFTDEWARGFFKSYKGVFNEIQAPRGWGIVFREIFHFEEPQFLQVTAKVPFDTCLLRAFNNDNGRELPTLMNWVAPTVYTPNTVCIHMSTHQIL